MRVVCTRNHFDRSYVSLARSTVSGCFGGNNIFTDRFIWLVGLACKNAILMSNSQTDPGSDQKDRFTAIEGVVSDSPDLDDFIRVHLRCRCARR